ncbi:SLC45 family MFS transporter [Lactiplantibacillus plantarum]|uniref:SLC45 family MFS transporter n=1 Tax=Lactiplantibacillus plantarum TaxID=1590 RepID=UPI0007E327B6|nr:SLC45 family MFS transporter [Lactiplantibacillus plantarum]ANI94984.1 MFS transporter [Lactiplantibacillus plantarum]AYG29244.1 MFS transporter [Lactiplantibacillus plantarum]MCB7140571.1 SLC45 family MFS transporter [Lactiplantibacillus plantarum]MCB7150336.1 SLC45 family MFS transporter [Lactiplantibacillus plantarum]MCB7158701.1 SLC45 family MFS transporter [Lactiplantibacillus plantarum]
MKETSKTTAGLPKLSSNKIWMMSLGFLGVQMAFTLQSSQMSRIFQTLGADPNNLGWFFILPPLAGLIVQPIIGSLSDRTWAPRLGGRRLPYLILGTVVAAIVMLLLPNSGSFGFGYASMAALVFGAITVAFLDLSSNVAMQPFKMMVGDMVNDDQKSYAYGIQSFLLNTGAVIAAIFPFLLTLFGVANTASKGVIPNSVIWSFYIGAAILVVSTIITIARVREYDPVTYAKYHGIDESANKSGGNWLALLKKAPKVFWLVALVQFFCWMAFQYLWTYSTGAMAANVWHTTNASSAGYQAAGNWYGILSAVQSVAAVVWSYVLAKVPNNRHKLGYALSLLLGAIGFFSIFFIHSQSALVVSFILVGMAWAAMNTYPLTMVTNALSGEHMGTYLGLFNGSICLPQIVASLLSFSLYPLFGNSQANMFIFAGIVLAVGAGTVGLIKETYKN